MHFQFVMYHHLLPLQTHTKKHFLISSLSDKQVHHQHQNGSRKLETKVQGSSKNKKKQQNPKRAAPKIIKPKKQTAKEAQKLTKIHQGQLMKSTEKLIASRVGHLELLKGTRREIEKENKGDKKKK